MGLLRMAAHTLSRSTPHKNSWIKLLYKATISQNSQKFLPMRVYGYTVNTAVGKLNVCLHLIHFSVLPNLDSQPIPMRINAFGTSTLLNCHIME